MCDGAWLTGAQEAEHHRRFEPEPGIGAECHPTEDSKRSLVPCHGPVNVKGTVQFCRLG